MVDDKRKSLLILLHDIAQRSYEGEEVNLIDSEKKIKSIILGEKVKLPYFMCEKLDNLLLINETDFVLWKIMQDDDELNEEVKMFVGEKGNALKVVHAILYGYEREVTEEELINEQKIKEIKNLLHNGIGYKSYDDIAGNILELFT